MISQNTSITTIWNFKTANWNLESDLIRFSQLKERNRLHLQKLRKAEALSPSFQRSIRVLGLERKIEEDNKMLDRVKKIIFKGERDVVYFGTALFTPIPDYLIELSRKNLDSVTSEEINSLLLREYEMPLPYHEENEGLFETVKNVFLYILCLLESRT